MHFLNICHDVSTYTSGPGVHREGVPRPALQETAASAGEEQHLFQVPADEDGAAATGGKEFCEGLLVFSGCVIVNQSMYYLKFSLNMEMVSEHFWIITSIH